MTQRQMFPQPRGAFPSLGGLSILKEETSDRWGRSDHMNGGGRERELELVGLARNLGQEKLFGMYKGDPS